MDCFQDFCLNCDRQATNDNYCSQSCKLADLGKASSPSSPTFPTTSSSTPSSPSARHKQPATQHHHHQDWTRIYTQPTSSDHQSPRSSYFMRPAPPKEDTRPTYHRAHRSLTPSSSRSSLDSTSNSSTGGGNNGNPNAISARARQELQEYFHAFDAAKASRRRQSTW